MTAAEAADGYWSLLSRQGALTSALIGNFFLRLAGASTGLMLTLYLGWINHKLYPVSATELGFIAGGFYLVEMMFAPIFGAQSDRRGRRWLLLLGPALGFIAVQMTAVTTVLAVLFVTRLLEGLSTASASPSLLGYLSARTESSPALRARVMSLFEVGTTIGLTLGTVVGSLLWGRFERVAFVLVGGVYLASAALFWRVRDADCGNGAWGSASAGHGSTSSPTRLARRPGLPSAGGGLLQSARRVARHGPMLRFMPVWLAVNAIVGLWLTHAIFQMTEGHHQPGQYLVGAFGSNMLAAILGAYTTTFGIGILIWGSLMDRFGELRTMRISLLGILGAAVMIGVINHSGGPGPLLWLAAAGFVVMVLVDSGFAPAAVSYLAGVSADVREDRGLVMGLYSVVLGLGQLLGGWLGGPLADRWGMDGVLALTFLFCLLALAMAQTLRPTLQNRASA